MKKYTEAERTMKKFHKAPFVSDLKDMLYRSARIYKNKCAFKLKDDNKKIYKKTYGEFKIDVISLGTSLLSLGLKNSKIALIGKNSYKWAISYLASSIVGTVVPIDKELKADDVINFLNISSSKAILGDKKILDIVKENSDKIQNKSLIFINFDSFTNVQNLKSGKEFTNIDFDDLINAGNSKYLEGDDSFDKIEVDPNETKILIFTSGTTGNAKGVCLSHRNLTSNVMSTYGIVKVRKSERVLSILPLHHTYECTLGFLLVIYAGGSIAYCDGLRYISQNLQEYRPTALLAVPLLLEKMYKKIDSTVRKSLPEKYLSGKDLSKDNVINSLPPIIKLIVKRKIKNSLGGRLRMFIVGAAPVPPEIIQAYLLLNIKTLQGYGLTETSPLVAGNNDFFLNPNAAGLPIPNVTYKIDNPDENGIGEIIVSGPNVMNGYYNNPEETTKVLKNGWFHTGDLGRIDKDGWLYITGRLKTMIVTQNGKKIFPEELEHYLNQNPLISESLVTGLAQDNTADEVYVNAQILPNMDAIKDYLQETIPKKEEIQEIIKGIVASVNKRLPNYKHIKSFEIREDEFEKTTTQKVKRYGKNMEAPKTKAPKKENDNK